jgi:hypothetical protein
MQLKDFNTLAEAQAYTVTTIGRIQGPEPKTAVETVNVFNGTRDRLASFTPNPLLTVEQQAQASLLAGMIVKALDNLFKEEFYLQLENPQIQEAYAASLALGVLTQVEYDGILQAATTISTPFKNATQHDFAVAKNDPTRFKSVTNTAIEQGYLKITIDLSIAPKESPNFEPHRPSVYKHVHGEYIRVTSFPVVSVAGDYIALVTNHRDLVVDNVYGVVV